MLFKLAFRNILRQRRRSLLTGLSMTGGFVLTGFMFSMSEGSYQNTIDFFTLDHTGHIQLHQGDYHWRPKVHKTIGNREAIESLLNSHEQVRGYAPRVYAPALAYAGNQTTPVSVIGIDPDLEVTTSRLRQKVHAGEFLDASTFGGESTEAMIGVGTARSLDIGIDDEIVLISQGADGSIANDIFRVVAVVGTKNSYDRLAVYLPLAAAQEFLSLENQVHEYALVLHNDKKNEAIAATLQRQIDALTPGITVSSWQQLEATFYRAMQSDKQGHYFSLGIVVFLVFIGVLNTVLMSVLERTREFGVIRAIGSRPAEVFKLIFIETMLMATLSIAVGLLLLVPLLTWLILVGFTLSEPINLGGIEMSRITGRVDAFVLLTPVLMIYVFSAIVTILPGIRAARITPKTAMGSH